MGKPKESAELLLQGNSPSQIASKFGISIKSVKQYLFTAVDMGIIRRSDILFFSISRPNRSLIEEIIVKLNTKDNYAIKKEISRQNIVINPEDLEIYLELRDNAFLGDLYVFVTELEKNLHYLIKKILQQEYNEKEEDWWKKGIPENVRCDCACRRERDQSAPAHSYYYTTFIQLKEILDNNWRLFEKYLPPKESSKKRELMKSLEHINIIRNKVMHPVRQTQPTEDEFEFIRDMHHRLNVKLWKCLS